MPVSPAVALVLFLAYVLVVNGVQYMSGVPYSAFFASPGNAMRSAVASLAAGALLLLAFARWSRWDGLWRDPVRLTMTPLMWVAPGAMVVLFVVRLGLKLSHGVPLSLLSACVLAGIGVGLTEELLFRGVVLRSLRTQGRSEAWAMVLSSAWFGAMHLTNALLGTPVYAAVLQACLAGIQGMTLYQFRRASGWLLPGMVVHGLWDISTFLPAGPGSDVLQVAELGGLILMAVLGLVSGFAVIRRERAGPSARAHLSA